MDGMNVVSMDQILNAKFGKELGTITANFKKTVKIREYETEVIELGAIAEVPPEATGVERVLALSILQAQLEYAAYISLGSKGVINSQTFDTRKADLQKDITLLCQKYQELTGKDPYEEFNLKA